MRLLSAASDATRALVAWCTGEARAVPPCRPPLRLVVRAGETEVSLALVDPAGRALFREGIDWGGYRRDVFDRCRARAQSMVQRSAIPVSLAIGQAVARSLIVPHRARAEIEAIIRAQVGRTIPLCSEEVTLGCAIRPTARNRLEVVTLAVPASLVARLLASLHLRADEVATLEKPSGDDGGALVVPFDGGAGAEDGGVTS